MADKQPQGDRASGVDGSTACSGSEPVCTWLGQVGLDINPEPFQPAQAAEAPEVQVAPRTREQQSLHEYISGSTLGWSMSWVPEWGHGRKHQRDSAMQVPVPTDA